MRNFNSKELTSAKTLFFKLWNTQLTPGGQMWLELCKSEGPIAPVGDSNRKTNAPGTYRQVGPTCPKTCQFLDNGCYAQLGPTGIQASKGDPELGMQLRAVAKALAWAIKTKRMVRLHVSGDFYQADGELDWPYIHGVQNLFQFAQSISGRDKLGWTYTHGPYHEAMFLSSLLEDCGLVVRVSEHNGAKGAIVADFNNLTEVHKPLKCPAQLSDTNCTKCGACWEKMEHTIVFSPHGVQKKKILKVIQG